MLPICRPKANTQMDVVSCRRFFIIEIIYRNDMSKTWCSETLKASEGSSHNLPPLIRACFFPKAASSNRGSASPGNFTGPHIAAPLCQGRPRLPRAALGHRPAVKILLTIWANRAQKSSASGRAVLFNIAGMRRTEGRLWKYARWPPDFLFPACLAHAMIRAESSSGRWVHIWFLLCCHHKTF